MTDFLKTLFTETSFDTMFVVVGLAFLVIAVVGNITGKITPGKEGRIAAAIIGRILLVVGLVIHSQHASSSAAANKTPDTQPQQLNPGPGKEPPQESEPSRKSTAAKES